MAGSRGSAHPREQRTLALTAACTCAGMFEAYDQDTKKLKAEQWRAQQRAERDARKPYWERPPWLVRLHSLLWTPSVLFQASCP